MAAHYENHTGCTPREGEIAGGEQHGTCEHDEPGVTEWLGRHSDGELPSVSSLTPRAGVLCRCGSGARHGGDDQGSPSRLRSPETVMRTALVNGSAFSSHACARSSSARRRAAFGGDEDFEHCELLPGQRDVAAVAVDLSAERIQTQASDLAQVACCGRACGRAL